MWTFSFSINPSNKCSGLISLKRENSLCVNSLLSKRTFRSVHQHRNSKATILWLSAFFVVQLSQLYMTTWKIIALTIQNFVGRVTSLRFNTLSRFVIAFLPRNKRLLISWLQSPLQWLYSPRRGNLSVLPPVSFYLPWSTGARCPDLSVFNMQF